MQKKTALILSVLITLVSLGAYYYLFACADRKVVFLYEHMGLTPFDKMTTGRYWMAGLVLSGFLTLLYLVSLLIIKKIKIQEQVSWKRVIPFTAVPLVTGVVFIIVFLGEPKLTFRIAMGSALALITGIAIGFSVADDLIRDYKSTFRYLMLGLGLVPFLILFRILELPEKGILTMHISLLIIVIAAVGGIFWLALFYRVFKKDRPKKLCIIKGILAIGYIGFPLLHYLLATPKGFPYITSSDNFFADNMIMRISNWFFLVLFVYLIDRWTKRTRTGG